jgi:uncharacterized DUF497 family protein
MKYDGFDWDNGNLFKNLIKHKLTKSEIEYFFMGNLFISPDLKHSNLEERFLAIGETLNFRFMIVAFTIRIHKEKKLIRPISARYMHEKEIKKYKKLFTQV